MSKLTKNTRIEILKHLLVWIVLFYLPVALSTGSGDSLSKIATHFWMQLVVLAIIFYINYLYLVDRFLFSSNKKLLYIICNIAIFSLMIYLRVTIQSLIIQPDNNRPGGPPRQLMWYFDFLLYTVPVAFAIALRSSKRMVNMEMYKAEAENIKLQSELVHLKFQLQPHFFFNSLNNIYSLIDTDPQKAQQSIHSMSKLMRHLLQASEAPSISLEEEIDFLKKYINLMQLRLTASTYVQVDFPAKAPAIHIAPLLFISLVENAFKHGISATQESTIAFDMTVDGHTIQFITRNTNFPKTTGDLSGSGIGLANLRKRLSLLYPNHFELNTGAHGNEFVVSLIIHVKE